jgi:monovalent cation/hydrogen antiporter
VFTVSLCLLLLAIVALTNGVSRAVRVPLPLLQIAAGAFLAWPIGLHVELEPEVFLLVFIPPLLFIDGWRIPKSDFKRFRRPILFLAFGLVVFTVLGLGLLIRACIPAIPLPVAFAIASALSPTDAVAVAGITGRVRVPPSLMHVLQGEALFNDASGLVCLRVAIATAATASFVWWKAAGELVVVAVGGIVIGGAIAWLFARFQRLVFGVRDDAPEGRILFITALPYACYLVGEHFHVSGILAAATAGMVLPRLGIFDIGERAARRQTMTVLGALELALNGLVFVLLGLQLPGVVEHTPDVVAAAGLSSWRSLALTSAVAATGLFALRFLWVWVSMRVTLYRQASHTGAPSSVPLRIVVVTALAGVRGAVSLAATLTIPVAVATGSGTYPARDVGVSIAATVIVLSLVSASIGLPFLLAGVSLPASSSRDERRASLRAELAEAAIDAIERERDARSVAVPDDRETVAEAANSLLEAYRARANALDGNAPSAAREVVAKELHLVAVAAQRTQLHKLWTMRQVDDVLYTDVLHQLDVTEEAIAGKPAHGHGSHGS